MNCLRTLPVYGNVVWGARTLDGDNDRGSEWKYVPVRRMALFLEESLFRGTQWVVFEPNDEPLWAQIRLNINAFMQHAVPAGCIPGRDAARGLLREVRSHHDHPGRHQHGHREHPRRLRAAQAGRVRGLAHPADRRRPVRPEPRANYFARRQHATVSREPAAPDAVSELQVPREMGRPLRRRNLQVLGAQALHRSHRASRGRRSVHLAQGARAAASTKPSRSSAA